MGDTCCFPFSMGKIKSDLEKLIPGIYVLSIRIGDSTEADELHGFWGNANDQVRTAAESSLALAMSSLALAMSSLASPIFR